MPTGSCKLCKQLKPLIKSHWISAAIWKTLRAPNLANPNPVVANFEISEQTSRQMQDYLLCQQCDAMLGAKGEEWVARNMYTVAGFPLKERLQSLTPVTSADKGLAYDVTYVPEISVDALAYFALSVFWRGAVHRWRTKGRLSSRLELGPYEEKVRRFLLDAAGFPTHMLLFIGVWYGQQPRHCIITPQVERQDTFVNYYLYVPGITFYLLVGKRTPEDYLAHCSYRNKLIHCAEASDRNCELLLREAHGHSRQSASLCQFVSTLKKERT
jgi:hypothetical protein